MLFSIVRYYKSLQKMKFYSDSEKTFSNWIYLASMVLMIFFLVGYVVTAASIINTNVVNTQNLLISAIFFFGAIFVLVMVFVFKKMISTGFEKETMEEEIEKLGIITDISQMFVSTAPTSISVAKALDMIGKHMDVTSVVIDSVNSEETRFYRYYGWKAEGAKEDARLVGTEWIFDYVSKSNLFKDLIRNKIDYIACNDIENNDLPEGFIEPDIKAYIIIPIYTAGTFWGLLRISDKNKTRKWEKDEIEFLQLIVNMISEFINRTKSSKELLKAKERAEKASEAKGSFLSRMSHEMRTPMTAIIGMTSIGKNAGNISRKDYCFEQIDVASTHLLGVINDVLDISKIEAGKFELSATKFSIRKMVENTVDVISFRVKEKNQRMVVGIDENVPAFVFADEQRLRQVLMNLLSNAVKFTPEEGDITIDIKSLYEENDTEMLQFSVMDSGIGISKEQQTRLFKSFSQADGSISRMFGGTGLGLAISKTIVEMMGGTIEVTSEQRQGATFTFKIKVKVSNEPEEGLQDAGQGADAASGQSKIDGIFKDVRILVAEDIDINREIAEAMLEPTGATLDFAKNGRETVALYKENVEDYDIVLMDVQMPILDGHQATRIIRSMSNPVAKDVPIIAMTANVFKEDIGKCLASGMNDHIGKPINIDEIVGKIEKYLKKKSS